MAEFDKCVTLLSLTVCVTGQGSWLTLKAHQHSTQLPPHEYVKWQ
jgi:hypothetical protein